MRSELVAVFVGLTMSVGAAQAVPVTGGVAVFTQELESKFNPPDSIAGSISPFVIDPVELGFGEDDLTVAGTLAVTGGTVEEEGALIELGEPGGEAIGQTLVTHMGALTFGNFIVDTAAGSVMGDLLPVQPPDFTEQNLSARADALLDFPIFDFVAEDGTEFDLTISSQFAGELTEILGLPDETGTLFQTLDLRIETADVAPVPVPAALPLLVGGIALLGFAARRRTA